MSPDVMGRLAAADPVREPPAVETLELLWVRIEDQMPLAAGDRRIPSPRLTGPRALAGSIAAIGACIAVLLLTGGSSDTGFNVAAAAYAATSPQPGIVEAVFLARSSRDGGAATLRQQDWVDAASGQRRELTTLDVPGAHPAVHQVGDTVFGPGVIEQWRGGTRPSIEGVERVAGSGRAWETVVVEHVLHHLRVRPAFAGIVLNGAEGIEIFRRLYRAGQMRLRGRVRRARQLLWKLESSPAVKERAGGTRLIVLVDPKTFLPVTETQVSVDSTGHRHVLLECDLVRYRHIPGGESTKLFSLPAQHPGARVSLRRWRPPTLSR